MILSGKKILFFTIVCMFLIVPAYAGTKYLDGSPELSAYVSGSNEFSPGEDVTLTIVIENTGLNKYKFVQSNIAEPDDQPNTAKFLTTTLRSGDAPVIIKSDPQMVGDLKGASRVNSVFAVKIKSDASAGTYKLPLELNYSYLYTVDQYGVDSIQYTYKNQNISLQIPVNIKSEVSLDVISAIPDHLNAGAEGYLDMRIKNTGSELGSKTIVKITQNSDSPVAPIDNSVYIGDFAPGSTIDCRYKVSVSKTAERQTYPVDISVVYENYEGDLVTSRIVTIGVPVGGKVDFEIISPAQEMYPGNKKVLNVIYRNLGETPVYSAQARLSAVDPFTSNDDIAFLGDIQPGEAAQANFIVSVDRAATVKEYGLDSEIRYRDSIDNTYISEPMKVNVDVIAPTGLTAILINPIYLSVIAALIIGIAYVALHYRKKHN